MRRWTGGVVVRACECLVTGLPAEAADALVMSCMVAGKTEWFFRCGVAEGEMVEFLEERESIKVMEGVYEVGFLFVYDGVCGSDVFEMVVCLVGMVQGEEGATWLEIGEDGDFQLFVI